MKKILVAILISTFAATALYAVVGPTLSAKSTVNLATHTVQITQTATGVGVLADVFQSQSIAPYKSILLSVENTHASVALTNLQVIVADNTTYATGVDLVEAASTTLIAIGAWTDCSDTLAATTKCHATLAPTTPFTYLKVAAATGTSGSTKVVLTGRKTGY